MLIIAETLPKWFRGIGVVPVAEGGIESLALSTTDDPDSTIARRAGRGTYAPEIMSQLADPDYPSLRSIWFGNAELDICDLYAILRRHSYTLRSLTFCNVTLNTSCADNGGIVAHLVLLVHWLRRECSLKQMRFYGPISDIYGTSVVCSSDIVGHETLVSRIETYICGRGGFFLDFPFPMIQLHRDELQQGQVFSIGARVYLGSKWTRHELGLEEDHTWYVDEPEWSALFYSVLAILMADLILRTRHALRRGCRFLKSWESLLWSVLLFTIGAAAFVGAFSLGAFFAVSSNSGTCRG